MHVVVVILIFCIIANDAAKENKLRDALQNNTRNKMQNNDDNENNNEEQVLKMEAQKLLKQCGIEKNDSDSDENSYGGNRNNGYRGNNGQWGSYGPNKRQSDYGNRNYGDDYSGYRNGNRGQNNPGNKYGNIGNNGYGGGDCNAGGTNGGGYDSSSFGYNSGMTFGQNYNPRRQRRYNYQNHQQEENNQCVSQCVFGYLHLLDDDRSPSETLLIKWLQEHVNGNDMDRIEALREARRCFGRLTTGDIDDGCEFSEQLSKCLNLNLE